MKAVARAALWLACAGLAGFAGVSAARADDRSAVLRHAEAALAAGDTARAADAFERAAAMLHAPDTEMGIVRTAMQQGRYRQALAFCAHTAGAHLESAPAGALYAWLLRVGGQDAMANEVLDQTLARWPADPVARDARVALALPDPVATGVLLEAPHRMAPEDAAAMAATSATSATSAGVRVPAGARVASSGVLIDGGTRALMPIQPLALDAGTRVWLRDGLGRSSIGTVEPADTVLSARGLGAVRLDTPLPLEPGDAPAARDAPAGSPATSIEYAAGSAAPAWPMLRSGFIGSTSLGGEHRLGIALAEGPHGGPVLDAEGRLAGIALPRAGGPPTYVPASAWRAAVAAASPVIGSPAAAARVFAVTQAPEPALRTMAPLDEAYERGLRIAVQVIVAARPAATPTLSLPPPSPPSPPEPPKTAP